MTAANGEFMKWLVCSILLLNVGHLKAQETSPKTMGFSSVAAELSIPATDNDKCHYSTGDLNRVQLHNWYGLYDAQELKVKPNENILPYWQCNTLKKNIGRDSRARLISPKMLMNNISTLSERLIKVNGKLRYVGLVPKAYRYDIVVESGVATALVKIHVRDEGQQLDNYAYSIFDNSLSIAEGIWNRHVASISPQLRFSFKRVDDEKSAHFSIRVVKKFTRGPYDKKWSLEWPGTTFAHEIGHMLGLDDEYNNINTTLFTMPRYWMSRLGRSDYGSDEQLAIANIKQMSCDLSSIMCYSDYGTVQAHHVYVIFARIFQENQKEKTEESL